MEQAQPSPAESIRIHQVPKHRLRVVLRNPELCALLAQGMAAARKTDALPTIMQLLGGLKQLWLVFDDDDPVPLAAWTTTVCGNGHDDWWLGVGELAGRQVRRWAGPMSDRMAAFAAEQGCARVIFFGRLGWKRLARQVSEIGAHDGVHVFERRIAS